MAYGATPAEPRQRPSTVTAASYLLYLGAVVSVLGAINAFTTVGPTKRVMTDAYRDVPNGSTVGTIASAAIVGTAVVVLLFAIGYLVLGMFVGRGSNAARIVTWVIAGLSVCCGGFGLIGNAGGSSFGGRPANGPDPAEVQRQLQDALPSWSKGVTLTLGVVNLLISLAVIVLLLLPASNAFFRKTPAQVWEPPPPSAPGSFGPPPATGPGPFAGGPPPAAGPPPGGAPPPPPA